MNHFHNFLLKRSAADVGLVGRHDEQVASVLELFARGGHAGKNFEFIQIPRGIRLAVVFQGAVDDAVAVEKDGAPDFGFRTSDFGLHRVLSHFVWPAFNFGCDTNKCQMTA